MTIDKVYYRTKAHPDFNYAQYKKEQYFEVNRLIARYEQSISWGEEHSSWSEELVIRAQEYKNTFNEDPRGSSLLRRAKKCYRDYKSSGVKDDKPSRKCTDCGKRY